ncbi:T-cell activation inhibitor, mitochondrial [Contarinia nasturtii]|uniref:T-cell activation inhibitor, mitochondrial n=1 Tax=Contarinia nasturtii TaxID=265458 RepID=UPI0012D4B857|nr:T-cell activation inhibitor, mitochondrial [Contarinia nasturtii]
MYHGRIIAKNVVDYSLFRSNSWNGFSPNLNTRRWISSGELSSVLRPFYFAVHPDLFGQHPEQRKTNEESLKHLSAYLEALQNQRISATSPKHINFYVRNQNSRDSFKLIRIPLERELNAKKFLKYILESCSLSTENVEKMKIKKVSSSAKFHSDRNVYTRADGSIYEEYEVYRTTAQTARQEKTLKKWLDSNAKTASERAESVQTIREDVEKLEKELVSNLKLVGIEYDCAWNFEHIRGCLKSLDHLSKIHPNEMKFLHARTISFARASGVSLEGHVMLSTEDVQHNWLDFFKNIPKQDEYLKHIPAYEQALSQVLREIKISRRKFMPKAQVVHYAGYLRKVTTSMLDYLTQYSHYPKSWPTDLSNFEIVIESEAGPLCVSPTGQFIAPSTCPGTILVEFLSTHMNEAAEKAEAYKKNKFIERELHEQCIQKLGLISLKKDDSVDPDRMIECLTRLIESDIHLKDCNLHITHYYSVLSDGTMCIPWDWEFE